jgi:hypothetical protein
MKALLVRLAITVSRIEVVSRRSPTERGATPRVLAVPSSPVRPSVLAKTAPSIVVFINIQPINAAKRHNRRIIIVEKLRVRC